MKESFTSKTYIPKMLSAFFALGSILLPFISKIGWGTYPFAALCLTLAFLSWRIPPMKIEIDESGIKQRQHGSSGSVLLARIYKPDTESEWKWIHSVSTTRLNGGSFLTVLYLFEDIPNKPIYRVTIESSIFKDYVPILRIIKDRATQAHFDETTELILNDKIDIRSVRPFYWTLFIFIVLSAFLYIYVTGKG